MNEISHPLTHYYQPTNNSCSQAALAMLLSHYRFQTSPEAIGQTVPIIKNKDGQPWGTINQQLATWCLTQDFTVELHTADFQLLDLSWQELPKDQLRKKLHLIKDVREVPLSVKDDPKFTFRRTMIFLLLAENCLSITI